MHQRTAYWLTDKAHRALGSKPTASEYADIVTVSQARTSGLLDDLHELLVLGTPGEVADEARRRLRKAGVTCWWPSGLDDGDEQNPWVVAAHMGLIVMRAPIAERGRYYHQRRTIVLRKGLSPEQEELTLWHEIGHAERGHTTVTDEQHQEVHAEALRRLSNRSLLALAGESLWAISGRVA